MERFFASQVFSLGRDLSKLVAMIEAKDEDLPQENREKLVEVLRSLVNLCGAMVLPTAKACAERQLGKLSGDAGISCDAASRQIEEVIGSLIDAMGAQTFFRVPDEKVRYLASSESEAPFGAECFERFPSARDEIVHAGRGLAFGLNAAAVFHLMRVMEVGLVVLGAAAGIKKKSPTWDAIIGAIDRKLNPKPGIAKIGRWRKREPWFAEANAMLRAVKIAWRNPTMHVTRNYDEEAAAEVYASVKAFMSHLATKLKERRNPRSS